MLSARARIIIPSHTSLLSPIQKLRFCTPSNSKTTVGSRRRLKVKHQQGSRRLFRFCYEYMCPQNLNSSTEATNLSPHHRQGMDNAGGRGIESAFLAILDATGFKDPKDEIDDCLTFLEAVRAASIIPENGYPPTKKIYEELFKIFRAGKSLELLMSSYQLLSELDKRYPQVNLYYAGLGAPLDSADFIFLVESLLEVLGRRDPKVWDMKTLGLMLLFQYLVEVLDGDFRHRLNIYKETNTWVHLKESLINMLLGSRRISYKGLVKNCMTIATMLSCPCAEDMHDTSDSGIHAEKPSEKSDSSLSIALVEAEKCICVSLRRTLVMMMELDESKKAADLGGQTTRADGVRTPALEIILDELTYDKDTLNPFFQVFDNPKWKLEIVVQYFWKYAAKSSVRTRRSNVSTDDATLAGLFSSFSNITNAKLILKKIGGEIYQLLLAHAFEAYLSFSSKQSTDSLEILRGSSLVEMCKSFISAFQSLRTADNHALISPFGKEALFTAASIVSTKS